MNEQELLELKEEIEEAKQKVSELKGERQALLKRLKEDWGCETVEEAEVRIKAMSDEIDRISEEEEKGKLELSKKLEQ